MRVMCISDRFHRMRIETPRRAGSLLAIGLLLMISSGCRYYGRYGAEEKTVAKIAEMNASFARALERAVSERDAFLAAAASRTELAPFADRFAAVVEEHGTLVDMHTRALGNLRGGPFGYTAANELLGSVVSEQELVRSAYTEVLRGAARKLGINARDEARDVANYGQVPPYYERIRFRLVQPTLDDILRYAS